MNQNYLDDKEPPSKNLQLTVKTSSLCINEYQKPQKDVNYQLLSEIQQILQKMRNE